MSADLTAPPPGQTRTLRQWQEGRKVFLSSFFFFVFLSLTVAAVAAVRCGVRCGTSLRQFVRLFVRSFVSVIISFVSVIIAIMSFVSVAAVAAVRPFVRCSSFVSSLFVVRCSSVRCSLFVGGFAFALIGVVIVSVRRRQLIPSSQVIMLRHRRRYSSTVCHGGVADCRCIIFTVSVASLLLVVASRVLPCCPVADSLFVATDFATANILVS